MFSRYDQAKLRVRFLNCLKGGKLEPFPPQMIRAGTFIGSENVGVYCSCWLPDSGEERMCSKCGKGFHESGEKIVQAVFKQQWFCTSVRRISSLVPRLSAKKSWAESLGTRLRISTVT